MIQITNCGHDSHHRKPCNIEHPVGLPNYLVLLVKKEAWFYLESTKQKTEPNMIIIFPPNTPIHYGCDLPDYNDDWIHFTMSGEDTTLLSTLQLPLNQPLYPHDFYRLSQYVQCLADSFHMPSVHTKTIADQFLHIFLYALDEELEKITKEPVSHKYYHAFARLRTQIYNDPSACWSVDGIAESLHLSLSYFQHLYKRFFSNSCQQDIIQARLQQARFYLTNSDMSIHNLALFCGYENELHFMRQFKKFVGQTPSEYRNAHITPTS